MNRLPPSNTQKIDRRRTLSLTWQGRRFKGLLGDSLASALFANNVRIFSRSLKYHRPRGLYSLDGESGNTLVNVDGECNVQATACLLQEGAEVSAQNYVGSLENDRLSFLDHLDGLMPAGFYYRRFHKPRFVWPMATRFIRKMAGTGVLEESREWNSSHYDELFPNGDVCVIGGGPAGMAAALAAADRGLRVVLLEARPWLGGNYDWRVRRYNGETLHARGVKLAGRLANASSIRVFLHTSLIDLSGSNQVTAIQTGGPDDGYEQRYISFSPRSVVVATGTIERPLVFEQNELPGIMQVGCAWRLARTYGVMPGRRAVFSVGDDRGLEAALDLSAMGMDVQAVADQRMEGHDLFLTAELERRGISFLRGQGASSAGGKKHVSSATISRLNGGGSKTFECDLLVASAGLTPVVGPLSTIGARLAFDKHTGFFLPREIPSRVHMAGSLTGRNDPDAIEADGTAAGLKAAQDVTGHVDLTEAQKRLAQLPGPAKGNRVAYCPGVGKGRKAFVCFDEDSTLKTALQSMEQGFDKPELAKRFGGFGLGPGQSGVPGHNLPLIMSALSENEHSIGPTTIRSPLRPPLMAALSGPGRVTIKKTPLHAAQRARGGVFERTGSWMRANRFSQDASSQAEINAVHSAVGLLDVSTLGKFRVYGPDASKVLQRVYISDMNRVKEGKLTYSAMLNEAGMLLDDGLVTRTGDDDYYLTTSSGRAAETEEWLHYHTRYEDWNYHVVNLTDVLAAVNLAGPRAREVLSQLTTLDISNKAFPYMGYREISTKDGIPMRILRVGFLGELSYELHFPASYGPTLWNRLMSAGEEFNIKPIGLEAQNVCRMEKGHVIIGLESEQRTTLLDLGLGFLWARDDTSSRKVGAEALRIVQGQKGGMKLAGLEIQGGSSCPGDGAIIHAGEKIVGYICTARRSVLLGRTLATALIREPLNRVGTTVHIYQNEGRGESRFTATVVKMPFYDPEGIRLRL